MAKRAHKSIFDDWDETSEEALRLPRYTKLRPKKLPSKAPESYDQRVLKSENPVHFLRRVWGAYLDRNLLFQNDLKRLDEHLYNGLARYSRTHDVPRDQIMPPTLYKGWDGDWEQVRAEISALPIYAVQTSGELPVVAPETYDRRPLKSENPIHFLNRVWGAYMEAELFFQNDLRRLDKKLLDELTSYCRNQKIPRGDVMPPQGYKRPRKYINNAPAGSLDHKLAEQRKKDRERAERYRLRKRAEKTPTQG